MSTHSAVPLPVSQRVPTLDILRGLALLGILVMNMPYFGTSFFAEADGSHLWTGPVDRVAEAARDMLFSGKFNSMFSLLFGIGFTIQYERMQRADPLHATTLYGRRLLLLGVLGVLHGALFWNGDILHVYAVLGVVLLLLRGTSERTVVALVGLCLLYPAVSGALRILFITPPVVAQRLALAQAFEATNNAAFGHGTFWEATVEHVRNFAFFYGDPYSLWNSAGMYVQMLLTMLLGMLLGRRRCAERIPQLMPLVRRAQAWTLIAGLAFGALYTVIFQTQRVPGPSALKLLGSVAYWLSRPTMMLFYVLTIVRLAQHPRWAHRLEPLAAAGRMPLTNYLLQTAICTTLFYGWGFGLWGRVGPAWGLVLALAIFLGVQVPWSVWWLRRHERGPLEAAWSRLTYGVPAAAARARVA